MAQSGREQGMRLVLALVVVLVVAAIALAVVLLVRGNGGDTVPVADAASTPAATAAPTESVVTEPADGPCPVPTGALPTPTTTPYTEQPVVDLDGAESVRATLRTTCGDVVLTLGAGDVWKAGDALVKSGRPTRRSRPPGSSS